ncbi:putative membrane protein [Kutzneria sp. 744]|nr:putative membrane protein [Kutzneria sp. 744]
MIVPTAIPLGTLWALLKAGSFAGHTDWGKAAPTALANDSFGLLLVVAAIVVVSAVLQPFQLRLVRMLEGYWDGWLVTARIAPLVVEWQRRRLDALRSRHIALSQPNPVSGPGLNLTEQASRHRLVARRRIEHRRVLARLNRYPEGAQSEQLLPTALGNALRAGEVTAGERYGLNTLASWSRLFPQLSDRFRAVHNASQDSVDTAANLTISFFLATALAIAGLWREPVHYWIPALGLVLTGVCYTGAVAAAVQYSTYLRAAYDLHRFDMLKALHYPMPRTPSEEHRTFERLSLFLRVSEDMTGDRDRSARNLDYLPEYDHSGAVDADDATEAENVDPK